jgi:hypothetical protein
MNLDNYVGDGRGFTICAVDYCTEPHQSKRLCKTHYAAWYKAQKKNGYIYPRVSLTELELAVTPDRGPVCGLHGCDNPQRARGLCNKHYAQYLRLKTKG